MQRKMNSRLCVKIVMVVLLAILTCLWTVSCSKEEEPKNHPPQINQATELQPVSFRLKWSYNGTSCGALIAKQQKFFQQEGLDVTINQGSFENDSKRAVVSGSDQIGLTGADELVLARKNGMPLIAIGVDFQKTPCCILAVKSSGITKPQDFPGKRLGVRKSYNVEYQYDVLLKRLGLDRKSVKEEPIQMDLTRIVEGKLDMWTTYISEKPLAEQKGLALNTIWFADYGIQSYGNVIFTTEDFLKNHPDVVRKFVKAYYKGWQWGIENPQKIGEIVQAFSPKASNQIENANFALTVPLLTPDEGKPLGYMTEDMWLKTQEILIESEQLKKEEAIDVKSIFTNEYLAND